MPEAALISSLQPVCGSPVMLYEAKPQTRLEFWSTWCTPGTRGGYAELVDTYSEAEFRGEIEMFYRKSSRGSMIVNMVLCGCAAYRAQLFLYLKACGREELGTANLWLGADAAASA